MVKQKKELKDMNQFEKAITASGCTPRPNETAVEFTERVVNSLQKVPDAIWESLKEEVQLWQKRNYRIIHDNKARAKAKEELRPLELLLQMPDLIAESTESDFAPTEPDIAPIDAAPKENDIPVVEAVQEPSNDVEGQLPESDMSTTRRKRGKKVTKVAKTERRRAGPKAAKAARASRSGTKVQLVAGLLKRAKGCTWREVIEATGWPKCSMPQQAKALGLKLRQEKVKGAPTRYYGS